MKISEALTIAASQFLRNYTEGEATRQLLEQYALEELDLNSKNAKEFAVAVEKGGATEYPATKEDFNNFFAWYYINYVEKKQDK